MLAFKPKLPILPFVRSALCLDPYPWQQETLCHVAERHPTALVACNGAGKTSQVLPAAALWCLFSWPKARIVVTSSSWDQIRKQLFMSAHQFRSLPIFRGWEFLETEIRSGQGGFITGISVDDPGRAEGFHQRSDSPVMILADECKTIDDAIFTAFAKCTATFRLYASSAGPARGTFYSCFTTQRNFWACITAKSSDCPHIPPESIEMDREQYGPHSPIFRNKHLAEFCGDDELSFIPPEAVRLCVDDPPKFEPGGSCAFIDWSTGGDECVIGLREGNRVDILQAFRETDSIQVVGRVARILKDNELSSVDADAGGLGGPLCDQLAEHGVSVCRVHNGSPARESDKFANLDAERWWNFRRALELRELILPADGELIKQLSSRKMRYDSKARIGLEPKEVMKARGLSSPDRADAVIGAWSRLAGQVDWQKELEDWKRIKRQTERSFGSNAIFPRRHIDWGR
jgi:hypothetical protein